MKRSSRAFTLIEVMVVVAIIGLLASIVLAAVREARLKAADAAVRQEAISLRTVMELERANNGSYSGIKSGGAWKAANSACPASGFTGQFATKASEVCTKLIAASSLGNPGNSGAASSAGCAGFCAYFQTVCINPGCTNPTDKFTIEAYLPYASLQAGAARYLCLGSSGGQSISDGAAWSEDGCKDNP